LLGHAQRKRVVLDIDDYCAILMHPFDMSLIYNFYWEGSPNTATKASQAPVTNVGANSGC
jgi:hypothetical protein